MDNRDHGQIRRIRHFEEILDRCSGVIKELGVQLDAYRAVRKDLRELEAYYTGPEWKKDFEDDEKGLIPRDLKRGVLSEDGISSLLEENARLYRQLHCPDEDPDE